MTFRPFCLGALVAALLVPAAAQAAEPGLNMNGGAAAGTEANFGMLAETQAKWARHFMYWADSEPVDDQYANLDAYKAIFQREQAMGVKPMLVVTSSPAWATSVPGERNAPPADVTKFGDFMGRLGGEYRGLGVTYEIWNEQDEAQFWKPGPDVARYVAMLRDAYTKIKAADPSATVLFGPTTGNNYAFVQAAYDHGAKGFFDGVAVHTDTACLVDPVSSSYRTAPGGPIAQFAFLGYRSVRAVMEANNDGAKGIYMSELGWSNNGLTCSRGEGAGKKAAGVGEAEQAQYLTEAYGCMLEDPYLVAGLWFNSADNPNEPLGTELNSYGLKRADGSPRAAFEAFKRVGAAGGNVPLPGPCGDFVAPRLEVKTPFAHQKVLDNIVLSASSPDQDVTRITFRVQSQSGEIRNFTNAGDPLDQAKAPARLDWQGVRSLPVGRHTLVVEGLDRRNNVERVSVPFERVDASSLRPRFRVRLTGRGRTRTLRVTTSVPGLASAVPGKAVLRWENRRGGRWKKIHGGAKDTKKTFSARQRLRYGGKWRVRVTYQGRLRRAGSPWKRFTVR